MSCEDTAVITLLHGGHVFATTAVINNAWHASCVASDVDCLSSGQHFNKAPRSLMAELPHHATGSRGTVRQTTLIKLYIKSRTVIFGYQTRFDTVIEALKHILLTMLSQLFYTVMLMHVAWHIHFISAHLTLALAIDICPSVRLSVRPSMYQTSELWQNEIIVCQYINTEQ